MAMFDCPNCGDTHHVNDFCATGPMSLAASPPAREEAPAEGAGEDAMKQVSIDQMRSAGFRVGLVSTHGNPAGTWGYTSPFGATGKGYAREEQAWAAASDVFLREKEEAQAYFSFSASPPAREEAPELALEDAKAFGIGFIVDGQRVSPDRVTVCRGEEAPAEGAGDLETAWRILEAIPAINDLPSQFQEDIQAAILSALRDRTSEPAGEAVGAVYGCGKADLYTAELPDGTLLYTHPAPATADKLREIAEGLSGAMSWVDYPFVENNTPEEEIRQRLGFMQKDAEPHRQALATLNEEG